MVGRGAAHERNQFSRTQISHTEAMSCLRLPAYTADNRIPLSRVRPFAFRNFLDTELHLRLKELLKLRHNSFLNLRRPTITGYNLQTNGAGVLLNQTKSRKARVRTNSPTAANRKPEASTRPDGMTKLSFLLPCQSTRCLKRQPQAQSPSRIVATSPCRYRMNGMAVLCKLGRGVPY